MILLLLLLLLLLLPSQPERPGLAGAVYKTLGVSAVASFDSRLARMPVQSAHSLVCWSAPLNSPMKAEEQDS